MYEEIEIEFPAFKAWLSVKITRRTRKSFREALAALGPYTSIASDQVSQIPSDKIYEVRQIIAENYPTWQVATEDYRPVKRDPQDALSWGPRKGVGWSIGSTTHTGYANEQVLFTIARTRSYNRGESQEGEYKIWTSLPGWDKGRDQGIAAYADTVAEGEHKAEQILHKFVHDIGAKFINE